MILENKGEKFKVKFSAKNFKIPEGKFEVTDALGNHILSRRADWGKDITVVSGPKGENAVEGINTSESSPVNDEPVDGSADVSSSEDPDNGPTESDVQVDEAEEEKTE